MCGNDQALMFISLKCSRLLFFLYLVKKPALMRHLLNFNVLIFIPFKIHEVVDSIVYFQSVLQPNIVHILGHRVYYSVYNFEYNVCK